MNEEALRMQYIQEINESQKRLVTVSTLITIYHKIYIEAVVRRCSLK